MEIVGNETEHFEMESKFRQKEEKKSVQKTQIV